MVVESGLIHDCHLLGNVFASVIGELKNSNGAWEDLLSKASKLQSAIKNSCSALTGFLDALQKIADMATNTKGATREIGSSLTRLCLRHRTLEHRLKELSNKMQDHFIGPMQNSTEEWRRVAFAIDKDHTREIKRARQDLKRLTSEALKAQKKAKKGNLDAQFHLDQLCQELSDRYAALETLQRTALRVALREERARYCYFIHCLKPMMEEEVAILDERNNVREILDLLSSQSGDPESLPEASEQAIRDLQGHQVRVWEVLRTKVAAGHIDVDISGSDGGSLSRKSSSLCSIDDDVSNDESDDENANGVAPVNGQNGGQMSLRQQGVISGMSTVSRSKIQRKLSEVLTSSTRMSTVAATAIGGSYDSGFMSQPEHYGPHSGPALVYSAATSAAMTSGGDTASGGSPESEPGIVMGSHQKAQMMMVNGSATMRPHTISQAYQGHGQRAAITQAVFDPPKQEQLYGTATEATTLVRLSKPVPPPRVPIRLNALDQPSQPVAVSGNGSVAGSDSISLSSDYAPIYANANELQMVAATAVMNGCGSVSGGGSISSANGFSQQQFLQQLAIQQQQQAAGGGRRQRSASTSSNDHYLELHPIGGPRTRTPQPSYASHQQIRLHQSQCDDQASLALAMRQLECTVTQLNAEQGVDLQQNQFIQTPDGMIYASVPMSQCSTLPPHRQQVLENNGTIRRAPGSNAPTAVKPTPPLRRGSSETLSVMHPNGRPQHLHQQAIYQQSNVTNARQLQPPPPPPNQQVSTPRQQQAQPRTQLSSVSAAAVAAVVDHAVSSAHPGQQRSSRQSSPQTQVKANSGKLPPGNSGQLNFQQQLTQAISQRQNLRQQRPQSVENVQKQAQSSQNVPSQVSTNQTNGHPAGTVAPPAQQRQQQPQQQEPQQQAEVASGESASSPPSSPQFNSNILLAALQSKRQQLRKTTPNDRSAPKIAR